MNRSWTRHTPVPFCCWTFCSKSCILVVLTYLTVNFCSFCLWKNVGDNEELHLPVINSYTLSCKFISLHMLLVAVESSYNVICFTALPDLFCWEITHEFDPGKDGIQVIVTIFFNILVIFLHFLFIFHIVHPDQVRMLSVVSWVSLWPSPVTPHMHYNMFLLNSSILVVYFVEGVCAAMAFPISLKTHS
jgi:hypothetical protein